MDTLNAYVDGSCDEDKFSVWAFIIIKDDKIIHEESGVLTGAICSIRNIGSEIQSIIEAVNWAKKNNCKLRIHHDLLGSKHWFDGSWKRNNQWTKHYYKFMQENREYVDELIHVKGHSGDTLNEKVDKLAGKTLNDYRDKL